jgi:hypothetical protein
LPTGIVIVALVIATVEPLVTETVFNVNDGLPEAATSPRAITVPAAVVMSKNDAVPVAAAVADVIVPKVATALVLELVATVNAVAEQVSVASSVPALVESATVGLVPE